MRLAETIEQNEMPALAEAQPACQPGDAPLRSGDLCPACGAGRLDYDGLLNLCCELCGFTQGGGAFT